jgi:hypothetical protein
MLMVAGPQSVSGSTNFPRAIENGVDWLTEMLQHALDQGCTRIEAKPEAEQDWVAEVQRVQERLLLRGSRGWFTGYNSNVEGHSEGQIRYQAYFGGAPRYKTTIERATAEGYPAIEMS